MTGITRTNGRLSADAARVGSLLLSLLIAGCASAAGVDPFAEELAQGHTVIRIGHAGSGGEEEITWEDGTVELLWSERADESAARALFLFVRCADHTPVSPEEFREVGRLSKGLRRGENLVLERSAEMDAHGRAIRVFLSKTEDRWVAEAVIVCPGPPPKEAGVEDRRF